MKTITLKWANNCAECGQHLEVGHQADYEKTTGIFCIGHFPTDPERIRHFRQIKADKKAARFETWADSAEKKSEIALNKARSMASVIPFGQPILVGHHSEGRDRRYRGRIHSNFEKGFEAQERASELRQKAESVRHVQVAGDAERKRQAKRDAVDAWIKPGMMVDTIVFGICEVLKVNTKTIKVKGKFGNFNVEKSFCEKVA